MRPEPVPADPRPKVAGPLDGLPPPAKAAEDRAAEERCWQPVAYLDLRWGGPSWPVVSGPAPAPDVFFRR